MENGYSVSPKKERGYLIERLDVKNGQRKRSFQTNTESLSQSEILF